jgi:phosphoribosylamine--glycine ligase
MKVLIIGSGGREHAFAWRCRQDKITEKIFIAPGNGGTSDVGENVPLNVRNFDEIKSFCKNEEIDFVIIGPEEFLDNGLADYLAEHGIICFGPKKNAARLESDKSFAKDFMSKYNIPTAQYKIFSKSEINSALTYLNEITYPAVIKVSGLAAGKGVTIVRNNIEAENTINSVFIINKFGNSGDRIVIEEFLEGEEVSVLVVTDGRNYKILPSAQDHKRVFDDDQGENTGGMGAYSPAPILNEFLLNKIENKIIKPTFAGLNKESITFSGCLYFGLMISDLEPYVIEYNSRFGDPETQAVLPLIEGEFTEFLFSAAIGRLNSDCISFSNSCSICVICASAGYPGEYQKNIKINGIGNLSEKDNIIIFHSGTKKVGNEIYTNGGRVLGITAIEKNGDLIHCKQKVYKALAEINFDGMHYRTDISDKAKKHLKINPEAN